MNTKIITIVVVIFTLFSCKKEKDAAITKQDTNTGLDGFIRKALIAMPDSPMYGTLSLGAYRNSGGASTVHYVLNGDFFSTKPPHLQLDRVDVGQIDFGTITVNPNTSNASAYYLSATQTYDVSNAVNFGKVTAFTAAGNSTYGISAFDDSIYVPKIVTLSAPFTGSTIGNHASSSSMMVNWNSDATNPNNAIVFLAYNGLMSHRHDSTLSDSSYIKGYVVPDNGSYIIPSSQFSGYGSGSFIEVGVARVNDGVKITGGKRYRIIAYSYGTALFKLN